MGTITIAVGDDWEGLYYNGSLEMEGHVIDLSEALDFVSGLLTFDVERVEVDIDWLHDRGSLPIQLEEVQHYVD